MRSIVLVLLLACSGLLDASDGDQEQTSEVRVEFRIENAAGEISDTFNKDDQVRFVFCVINDRAEPANIAYTFPPHRVRITPVGSDEAVWEAHYGRMFPQVMKHSSLAAGERLEFDAEWDLHFADKPDQRVPAGEYEVQPEFHAFLGDSKLPSELAATTITVRD